MNKRGKQVLVFSVIALIAVVLISILAFNLISASNIVITSPHALGSTPGYILAWNSTNQHQNLTFTIQNTEPNVNITGINITLPENFTISYDSNGTTPAAGQGGVANFSYEGNVLNWSNSTFNIVSTTARNFWIYANVSIPGYYGINVSVRDNNSRLNSSIITVFVVDLIPPAVEQYNATDGGNDISVNNNNSYFNTTSTLNFACNATDDVLLATSSTITLYAVPIGPGAVYTNTTVYTGVYESYHQANFTLTITEPGTYIWYCKTSDLASPEHVKYSKTNYTFTVNAFSFSGWVKNSTYNNVSGANISIYEFVQSQQGPPLERIIKSITTSANGQFNLTDIQNNGSQATIYKLKVKLNNSDGDIIEVGPNLPQFPREPLIRSMNGGTFYLQNATTIQIYAYNNISNRWGDGIINITHNVSKIKFGYEVIDQALGFPIESSIQSGVYTVNVTVPASRNYTVMLVRDPSSFIHQGGMDLCAGPGYMNETDCPSPPSSLGIRTGENITAGNYLITVNMSLAFSQYNLTGCLNIVGNTTDVNLTDIASKMIPWEGFLPPIKGEISDFNAAESNSFKAGPNGKGCKLGRFNLTLMGSASGINWFIEAYANGSNEYFAAFQNITISNSDKTFNLSLVKMLGTYLGPSGEVNTSKMEIAIMDSNGTAPQQTHVELYVKNSVFGTMHYIIETLTNGKFNFTLNANTTEASIRVYSNMYAPKETKIKLYTTDVAGINRTNVTLYSFRPQKMLDNGSISSEKISGSGLAMRFMRYSTACNVYQPPLSCRIGDDKNANFDPLQAMMAGKSNLWMKTKSNITLYFINVDMMASGPPDAMMNDNASSASSSSTGISQVWKFGSMAPNVYDYVIVGIPYNNTVAKYENWTYYMNLSFLYDNDWNVIWNATANGSGTAQIPSAYADYSSSWFTTPGILCYNSTSSTPTPSSQSCFMNTTNTTRVDGHAGYFWFTLPHFSSTANKITGKAVSTPGGGAETPGGAGPGGGGATTTYDLGNLTSAMSKQIAVGEAIKFTIENASHTIKLIGLTASSVSVQIRSVVITKLLQLNQSAVNIDIDADGVNEFSIKLDSVSLSSVKASFTITPLVGLAVSTPTTASCGDNICQGNETCSNCAADCGCATGKECVNSVCTEKAATTPTTTGQEQPKSRAMLWTAIISALVLVILTVILIRYLAGSKHDRFLP